MVEVFFTCHSLLNTHIGASMQYGRCQHSILVFYHSSPCHQDQGVLTPWEQTGSRWYVFWVVCFSFIILLHATKTKEHSHHGNRPGQGGMFFGLFVFLL